MTKPTIIVTGASRGIGAAIGRAAAQLGANIVLNARSEIELQAVATKIGAQAVVVSGSVANQDDCAALVETAVSHFGRIDAVVNNAGIIEPVGAIADTTPEAWEHNWRVNVLGPMMLTQAALPHLRATNGRVINVSSGAATGAIPGWGAYCVAKGALNQFNHVLSVEERGITAVSVRPGIVDTDMQATIRHDGAAGMPADAHARFVGFHEKGQLLPPETPGMALAVLALHAPAEWSGQFMGWDDEPVQALVARFGMGV